MRVNFLGRRRRLVYLQIDLTGAAIYNLWSNCGRRSSLRGRRHGDANDLAGSLLLDLDFLGWRLRCRRLLCAVARLRVLLGYLRGRFLITAFRVG